MKLSVICLFVAFQCALAQMANISASCMAQLSTINLNDKLTIVRSIDAWGKPTGVLEGAFTALGDYQECKKLNGFSYILVDGFLQISTSSILRIGSELGICVPSLCANMNDVIAVMKTIRTPIAPEGSQFLLALHTIMYPIFTFADPDHLGVKYIVKSVNPAKNTPWGWGSIVYLSVWGFIFALVLVATFIDYIRLSPAFKRSPPGKTDENEPLIISDNNASGSSNRDTVGVQVIRKKDSLISRIVGCFSLYANLDVLFRPGSSSSSELNVLNVIRAISMWWVICGHVAGIFIERAPVDVLSLLEYAKNFWFVIILNAFFSVDSFFFLGAFLLTYIMLKTDAFKKFNYIKYVLFRYMRLTFSYAMVTFGWFLLYPHLGEGPLWYVKQDENPEKCMNTWWNHLLYLNELYPELMDNSCMSWSWYLAADFHLYMIAPIFIYALYKIKSKSWQTVVFTLSFLVLAAITISTSLHYEMPAIATPEERDFDMGRSRYEHKDWLAKFYQKPWNHLTVYLVGILTAYVALNHRTKLESGKSNHLKLGQLSVSALQLIGATLMFGTLFLPYNFTHDLSRWPLVVNALYNYFSRITWSLGIGLFIYPTVVQPESTHLLTKFWAWNGWTVMARLTYGVYLVHIILVQILLSAKQRATPFLPVEILFIIGGTITWGYVVSMVLFVTVESPFGAIMKIMTCKK